ncbi:MAG: S-layer homology domain-containing protein [Oscillospiraceae bacterium]|nr:S-layer homology domain-containing protein [Oscillospiraceae bacterium]
MSKRILSFLFALALLLPVSTAFGVSMGNDTRADAHIESGVHPEDCTYAAQVGEHIQIILGVRNPVAEHTYVFHLMGDGNLQHGTLTPHTEPGHFTYHATSAGTETFVYTVSVDGIVSHPATVTITVDAATTLPFLQYKDMQNHWAAFSAGRLAYLGKLVGMQADNHFFFHPDRGITRGDFLIWLCAVLDIEPTTSVSTIYVDSDIPQWMIGFLDAATIAGVIEGAPAANPAVTSYFSPNTPVTRIEAISMISRALGTDGHDDDLTGLFLDITEIPAWGKNAVRHLAERQVLAGNLGDYLQPNRNLSRAEGAEMLYKALKDMVHTPAPGLS